MSMAFYPGGLEDDFDDDDEYGGFVLGDENFDDNVHISPVTLKNQETNSSSVNDASESTGRGGFGAPIRKGKLEQRTEKTKKAPAYNKKLGIDDFRMAITRGNIDTVKQIAQNKGFDINSVLKCGWTGLMYAANSAHKDIVEFLVKNKANVSCHHDMFNALMAACSSTVNNQDNILTCVDTLLKAGADVNSHDRYHMTPLIYAARECREQVVSMLLDNGANVNKQDSRGWTALSWSVSKTQTGVVRLLMDRGADPNKIQCDGQTPLDLATLQQNDELIAILGGETRQKPSLTNEVPSLPRMVNGGIGDTVTESDETQTVLKYGELELFLCGLDLSQYVGLFQQQHLDFSTVLRMTDEDLIKMGIHQIGVRKKILDGIRTVHKKEWETTSLHQIQYNKQLSCADTVAMVANISKHCKYIGTTTGYIRDQILRHPETLDVQDGTGPSLLVQHTEDTMKNVQTLYTELEKLTRTLNIQLKKKDFSPPDLISIKRKKAGFKVKRILGICVVTFGLGILWWKRTQIIDTLTSVK